MEYEIYEKECEKIIKDNADYLDLFEAELNEKGLMDKTIRRHISNVDFYLNTFNIREDADTMQAGCYKLHEYFGYFFIRKCMWSTPATIKSTASSLKKFYSCMLKNEKIEKDDYKEVVDTIKNSMEEWIDTCADYNDPDQINPFMFF